MKPLKPLSATKKIKKTAKTNVRDEHWCVELNEEGHAMALQETIPNLKG